MIQQEKSRPDLKQEGRGRKKPVSENIQAKDIALKITLPGNIQKPSKSSKLNRQSLIRIMIADNPKLSTLPYWKVERMFNKLSKRQQENIAKNRKWFTQVYPKPEELPVEYHPAPYFHIPATQSEATKVVHLSDEQIASFINQDNYPSRFNKKKEEWERMTERQRLVFHLNQISEGNPYKWEYVE